MASHRRLLFAHLSLVSSLIALEPACGCVDTGCSSGFVLLLEFEDHAAMPEGEYLLSVVVDDTELEATCDLSHQYGDCQFQQVAPDPDGPNEDVWFDVWDLNYPSMPQSVSLEITHMDEQLFADAWQPEYETDSPGSNACSTCEYAGATAVVPVPSTH